MRGSTTVGIGLGVLAYGAFNVHDATMKWLVAELPVWQVIFLRSATICVTLVAVGGRDLLVRAATSPMRAAMIGRGALLLGAWLLFFTASRSLPLAQLLTLYFAAPILTTLMAPPLLGERLTRARLISVLIGFAGVLVACDPLGMRLSWPALMVLGAACLWGYGVILMRRIARRESSVLQMLGQNGFFMVVTGIGAAFTWQTPQASQLLLMLVCAALGGLGQFCIFEAARHAPATVMATVEYSSLLWAFVLGYAIWGDVPTQAVWLGAALILAAGLLLVLAERRGVPPPHD
ncbi:DMT family transporter [Rhodovastum atsumiense]|uniref:DMT family transporter n=1 Tax=Rhodovastum atsumiense TaxID=504468 RepID=UPI00139F2C7D|nr:DMT family transporter [Rhodovastum atsumiense]CAH2600099.1 DMT family transporter [Rhodovastum atsumiense]